MSEAPASPHAARQVPRYTSYPTAPHFGADVDASVYGHWLDGLEGHQPLSLYVHVPFCSELCLYCGCQTTVTRSYAPVSAYVDLLEQELDLVAQRLPRRHTLSHLHFGGGTPTILRPSDFRRLMRAIGGRFDLAAGAELAVEVDPRTISPAHAATLAEVGINRVSLGVQSFDPLVQATIRRLQSFELTARVAEWLRFGGIEGLNLDLMYGLPHQTVANVLATVEKALALAPDRIALFGYAHVPWMRRHQALLAGEALPDSAARSAQLAAATASILAAGYVAIGLDHFALPDDPLALQAASGTMRRNFQGYTTDAAPALLGLGASAISRLPQGYAQNAPAVPDYRAALETGRLATVRGVGLTAADRLRGDIIERLMCDLQVDLESMCRSHGVLPAVLEPDLARLDPLAQEGLASVEGSVVRVAPGARSLARLVAAAFDERSGLQSFRHSQAV